MKKVVTIIFFILTAFIFAPKISPIYAACVKTGQCKTAEGCCSGYSKTVKGATCASLKQCIDATDPGATPIPTVPVVPANTCSLLQEPAKTACEGCMDDGISVWTAIGCVEATSTGLLNKFLPFAIGIAGGIAFLLILFGALQMMMSAGNPEKLNAGKELVTAAITGLLLIIFSMFILQLVGVTILKIPGFE